MQSLNNYDLEDRTAKFGEAVIEFCKAVPQDIISKPLISQLVRSGTSVGANYAEANGGSSKKDFRNKISICKKEIQETKHWIRMIVKCTPQKDCRGNIMERSARADAYLPIHYEQTGLIV